MTLRTARVLTACALLAVSCGDGVGVPELGAAGQSAQAGGMAQAGTINNGGGLNQGGSLAEGGGTLGGSPVGGGGADSHTASGGVAGDGGTLGGGAGKSSSAGQTTGGSAATGGSGGASNGGAGGGTGSTKLRVVMSTDFPPTNVCLPSQGCPSNQTSDPDDVQSMVRFLLYANEFDVEGLLATAGTFAGVANKQNILDMISLYEMVYDNLKKHDAGYPTPAALRSVTHQGRNGTWGQSTSNNIGDGKDTEASDALIAIVDKPDPRPVYVGLWGDASQVAQAVWKVQKTRSAPELEKFLGKLRIHQIAHQDETIDWLLDTFPKLFIVYSKTTYFGVMSGDLAWVNDNIRNNHGPLAAVYPPAAISGPGVIEGDSPSFLILVSASQGLNNPEDPTQESWGGQFKRDGDKNHYLDGPGGGSISKWRSQSLADFAKRADWCVH